MYTSTKMILFHSSSSWGASHWVEKKTQNNQLKKLLQFFFCWKLPIHSNCIAFYRFIFLFLTVFFFLNSRGTKLFFAKALQHALMTVTAHWRSWVIFLHQLAPNSTQGLVRTQLPSGAHLSKATSSEMCSWEGFSLFIFLWGLFSVSLQWE